MSHHATMQPSDQQVNAKQLNDAEAQLNEKLKDPSDTILGILYIDIGTISNVRTAGSYRVEVLINYSHFQRKFELYDSATEYMNTNDSKLVLNTKFQLELHEIQWTSIDFSLMKRIPDHFPATTGHVDIKLADLQPHKVMTFKEPLGDGDAPVMSFTMKLEYSDIVPLLITIRRLRGKARDLVYPQRQRVLGKSLFQISNDLKAHKEKLKTNPNNEELKVDIHYDRMDMDEWMNAYLPPSVFEPPSPNPWVHASALLLLL